MLSYLDFKQSMDLGIDMAEQKIADVHQAEHYLSKNRPQILQTARYVNTAITQQFGPGLAGFPNLGYDISVLCLARVALRHGSMTNLNYHYHNETHSLDVLKKLLLLAEQQVEQSAQPKGAQQLDALSCLCLTIFAVAHDIWQTQAGYSVIGIGHNEYASVEETMRILVAAGLDQQQHQSIFQLLRWMIYGSTFFTQPLQLDDVCLSVGALAPVVAQQVLDAGNAVGEFSAAQAADLVLLAADIDTSNVAETISGYAEQSVRVCREVHRGWDFSLADQTASRSVLGFLTDNQEQYFFKLQYIYSPIAQAALNKAKQQTGELLRQLVAWIRDRYNHEMINNKALPAGDVIINDFLSKAAELNGQSENENQ